MNARVLLFLAATVLAGCRADQVPNGSWGGDGAALVVTDNGASVQFQCGRGTIDHPLRLDDQGRFSAVGTFRPEKASGTDEAAGSRPARYQGRLERDRLEFTVTLEGQTARGPYSVALAKPAELKKCSWGDGGGASASASARPSAATARPRTPSPDRP